MKIIHLIGIAVALALCITPVAAVSADDVSADDVSADDFEIYISQTYPSHGRGTYKYWNLNNKSEIYTFISTGYTIFTDSLVTFKPANIPDAPVMEVVTYMNEKEIFLPRSVDEWEIKYYSCHHPLTNVHSYHLKCADVINMNEFIEGYKLTGGRFDKFMEKGLGFQVGICPCLYSLKNPNYYWYIPYA